MQFARTFNDPLKAVFEVRHPAEKIASVKVALVHRLQINLAAVSTRHAPFRPGLGALPDWQQRLSGKQFPFKDRVHISSFR